MILMCPAKRLAKLSFLFLILSLFVSGAAAQAKKKPAAPQKPAAKKNEKSAGDARKDAKNAKSRDARQDKNSKNGKKETVADRNAKKGVKDAKGRTASRGSAADRKRSASRDEKKPQANEKLSARELAAKKKLEAAAKKDPKKAAELRRADAARKKAEEERRQAELAERRRREQAAREARERQLAFERGLRTQTIENIAADNTEGEDPRIRAAAVEALGNHAGTVVVMEAKTGKVLTIVNQDWAIRDSFKPCSTIKLVTGVAGLNENVIMNDGGIVESTGALTLDPALARSNNPYFQRVGSRIGSSKMIEYARSLGLGEQTGINAEGETPGKLPYGNNNARIYSHGDDFEVTPLQLAVMVSALSNGGKRVVPQIPRTRVDKANFQPKFSRQVGLPESSIEGVLPGMIGAAEYGTARRGVDASMGVAGKTGSCISKNSWVGLFASVAPVEDPKYAVVVITRGQSERGSRAAAVAGRIYRALRPGIVRNPNSELARRLGSPGRSNVAARAVDTDEEGVDEAAYEAEFAGQVPPSGRTVEKAPKKLIQKTTQSTPAFSPVVIEFDKSGKELTRPRIVRNR
jgi:penicillin-binding protein 2